MEQKDLIILIPHYNNTDALIGSLQSINESFSIDLMIVDDGSAEPPVYSQLKEAYSLGSIYYDRLEKNLGIEYALNRGLELIQEKDYKFIGRLDVGDLCYRGRFRKQIEFLNNNPNIMLLGSQVNFISEKKKFLYTSNLPVFHKDILKSFYKNCTIIHPTVVFRSSIIKTIGFYPINYRAAEDYAFFFKIIKKFKCHNFDEVLLDVIVAKEGISTKKRRTQIRSKIRIIYDNFYLGIYPIYGLLRNCILLLIPFKVLLIIKRKVFYK